MSTSNGVSYPVVPNGENAASVTGGGYAYTTYRGVMGAQPVSDPASNSGEIDWMQNGVLYPNSATKLSDITDGTSNTLLMGDSRFGFWGDGSSCCARFRNDRWTPTDFDNYWFWVQQPPVQTPVIQYFSFGSLHDDAGKFRPVRRFESADFQNDRQGPAGRAGDEGRGNPDRQRFLRSRLCARQRRRKSARSNGKAITSESELAPDGTSAGDRNRVPPLSIPAGRLPWPRAVGSAREGGGFCHAL